MSDEKYELMQMLLHTLKEWEPLPWQDWMEGFLEDLERSEGHVSIAIDLCEVSRDTVYKYRRRNQQFARRWDAIIQAVRQEKRAPRQPARRRLDAADQPQRLLLPNHRRRGPASVWLSVLQGIALRRRPTRGVEERAGTARSRRGDTDPGSSSLDDVEVELEGR
jgi:hypothetical protein